MENSEKTRSLLIKHYKAYPELQIQDVFKFLYQSSFGCEHLISSLERVTDYIAKEYNAVQSGNDIQIEQLDGNYSRVHLSYLKGGISVDTFGKLFFLSAKKEVNALANLEKKLEVAKNLVLDGLLPFSVYEFENAVNQWKNNGYHAISHSDIFRGKYKPSYRLIANEYIPFLPLFAELDKRISMGRVRLAVEGGSASGKTTLSKLLESLYDCTLFHMDDFFLQPEQRTAERFAEIGGNVDRERFLNEVLQPLKRGDIINYRRFNCQNMKIEKAVQISPKKLTVIEGAYSMHPELAHFYDYSVFLDIGEDLQKKRIENRNTPELAKRFFNEWIPLEKIYFEKTNVKKRCDRVIEII